MALLDSVSDALPAGSPMQYAFVTVPALYLLYLVGLVIYRLYFHPLSKFPGPKLAAASYYYEAYFEINSPGGQWIWEYRRLHKVYGPIVRINPDEVHIQDSRYFEELYKQSMPLNKLDALKDRFNNPLGLFATPGHELHGRRRKALSPLFSKRNISAKQDYIQQVVDQLCARLQREFKGTTQYIPVREMWGALTCDLIVAYCFNKPYNFLEAPMFHSPLVQAITDLVGFVHIAHQFPWTLTMFNMMPEWLVGIINPALKSVFNFNHELRGQIKDMHQRRATKKEDEPVTVFSALLDSSLPPAELSKKRLEHEAIGLIGAGIETTLWALTIGLFHIYTQPNVRQNLRDELFAAIPDPNNIPPLDELEKLPYLTACIEECVRLNYGTSQRAPRTHPKMAVTYKDWVIPPNYNVSMDNYSVSHDEEIFPDSHTFKPERWLNDPLAPDGRPLKTYLVSFGRGPRMCLGRNLAYAEMYIAMATVYRRFDFELYNTQRDAVDLYCDYFTPRAKPGTQVKALVKA